MSKASLDKSVNIAPVLLPFTAQKMKFSIKDFFSKCDQIQFPADLVTFVEKILNGKLHFCALYILGRGR